VLKRSDQAFLERLIRVESAKAYGETSVESYWQLPPATKALVIDDWDDAPLLSEDREAFLKLASAYFGKVVLFVEGVSYIEHLQARVKGTSVILEFDLVILRELSYVARGNLIDRWLSLEPSIDNSDHSRKVEETERLVKSVIGKNTLPSLPFIVLAILQASQRVLDVLPENGSFGYLYEVLITTALNSSRSDTPQLDKKFNFLSLLAFRMFEESLDVIGESVVEHLIDEYAESFRIKIDKKAILDDLLYARVLMKADGNYSFTYAHYFHYFLARHFKNHLHGAQATKLRHQLTELAGGLNAGSNGIFLMFVIYLTHDDQLTDELVAIGQRILSEFEPSDLTQDVEFYNSKDFAGVEQPVPQSVDLEASRQQRRTAVDKSRKSGEPKRDAQFGLHQKTSPIRKICRSARSLSTLTIVWKFLVRF
jgi:hypothetical protein